MIERSLQRCESDREDEELPVSAETRSMTHETRSQHVLLDLLIKGLKT